jgi:hypothetical protein
MIRHAVLLAALMSTQVPSSAQVSIGARYGQGGGTTNYNIGELHVRVRAIGPLYVNGAFEIIGGGWACAESSTSSLVCGYDGNSISVGPVVALVDTQRFFIAGRGAVGWFERTGTYGGREYTGSDHATVSVGVDGEVALAGPIRLQVGLTHRRILDEVYEDVTGEVPHLTAFVVGVGLAFRSRSNGG